MKKWMPLLMTLAAVAVTILEKANGIDWWLVG